ncbi:MAG: hypothetical protein MUE51_03600 [Thermoleophilia bacterium]|jgi:hypothetical protein|nr:hypothetical protein [Thermoleophilia bacterium]
MPRRLIVLGALALALALAGCGGSLGPATTPLAPGTTVSAERYLADTAEAADAARDARAALVRLPPAPTPAELRAVAAPLTAAAGRVRLARDRLAAARLEDQRLDAQRRRAVAAYVPFSTALDRMAAAARRGDPEGAAVASAALAGAAAALREVGGR